MAVQYPWQWPPRGAQWLETTHFRGEFRSFDGSIPIRALGAIFLSIFFSFHFHSTYLYFWVCVLFCSSFSLQLLYYVYCRFFFWIKLDVPQLALQDRLLTRHRVMKSMLL